MGLPYGFGDDPNPLHSVRLGRVSSLPTNWAEEDVAPALGHARLTKCFAHVCRGHFDPPGYGRSDNQGDGGTLGLFSPIPGDPIPRYRPLDPEDGARGGPCGRCGRQCGGHALASVRGQRLCPHCRALRLDPARPRPVDPILCLLSP